MNIKANKKQKRKHLEKAKSKPPSRTTTGKNMFTYTTHVHIMCND